MCPVQAGGNGGRVVGYHQVAAPEQRRQIAGTVVGHEPELVDGEQSCAARTLSSNCRSIHDAICSSTGFVCRKVNLVSSSAISRAAVSGRLSAERSASGTASA